MNVHDLTWVYEAVSVHDFYVVNLPRRAGLSTTLIYHPLLVGKLMVHVQALNTRESSWTDGWLRGPLIG